MKFLKKKGYLIKETNYKTRIGEIDIIAQDNETTVFVEVKTRTSGDFGRPGEAVNYDKRQKYVKVAEQYLIKNGLWETPCRFDVVEIENGEINHVIDAFSA